MGFILRCLLVSTAIGVNSWILRRSCIHYAIFSYIRENAVLQGSIIATLKNKSPAECESECINAHFCKSINTENGGDRKCELNIETAADTTANLTLTPKTGWTFKSTNYSDPWVGEYCKYFKPCPVNHVCMDSCDCPGYECYRCRGMKIGINCLLEMVGTGKPLGVEDKSIKDDQISASSSAIPEERGHNARLNLNERWCSQQHDKQPYLRVDFATRKIITDIAIQGHHSHNAWVTSYELEYTEDFTSWQTYEEDGVIKIFDGTKTRNVVVKQSLQYYIRAFSIKLRPKTWLEASCMRIEVYGVDDLLQPSDGCGNNERPLGMESEHITNNQITASSTYNSQYEPFYARLNKNANWCSIKNELDPFLQVDLGKKVMFTAVAVQGTFTHNAWTKRYRVSFSDGPAIPFKPFGEVFPGNTDSHSVVINRLSPAIAARVIRVIPVEAVRFKWGLRVELYGCE